MGMTKLCVVALFLLPLLLAAAPATVESVTVKTRAPNNREAPVHYRVPKDYDAARPEKYRILVIFGGRNSSGKNEAGGALGWGAWADEYGIFLVSPGFRDDEYWDPKEWSGKALMDAVGMIGKQYRVCGDRLFYYGYSAGSQAANLFANWRPGSVRAWVSHACGVFHEPGPRMRSVPGLVTCGDADIARYIISRRFVDKNRKFGISILWRSFPNSPHDVPPDSLRLARAFLTYYHTRYLSDVSSTVFGAEKESVLFVGDDQENIYYPADSPKVKTIAAEDRVPLFSKELASAWGRAAK